MMHSSSNKTTLTKIQTLATIKTQKHPFHILGSSPFPMLAGVFTLLWLLPFELVQTATFIQKQKKFANPLRASQTHYVQTLNKTNANAAFAFAQPNIRRYPSTPLSPLYGAGIPIVVVEAPIVAAALSAPEVSAVLAVVVILGCYCVPFLVSTTKTAWAKLLNSVASKTVEVDPLAEVATLAREQGIAFSNARPDMAQFQKNINQAISKTGSPDDAMREMLFGNLPSAPDLSKKSEAYRNVVEAAHRAGHQKLQSAIELDPVAAVKEYIELRNTGRIWPADGLKLFADAADQLHGNDLLPIIARFYPLVGRITFSKQTKLECVQMILNEGYAHLVEIVPILPACPLVPGVLAILMIIVGCAWFRTKKISTAPRKKAFVPIQRTKDEPTKVVQNTTTQNDPTVLVCMIILFALIFGLIPYILLSARIILGLGSSYVLAFAHFNVETLIESSYIILLITAALKRIISNFDSSEPSEKALTPIQNIENGLKWQLFAICVIILFLI